RGQRAKRTALSLAAMPRCPLLRAPNAAGHFHDVFVELLRNLRGEIGAASRRAGRKSFAHGPRHGASRNLGSRVGRRARRLGALFGLGAACGQGFGSVISTKAGKVAAAAGEHLDGGTAAYQRILAGLVLTVIVFLFTRRQRAAAPPPTGNWSSAWGWVTANA